jgi:hypothetical protein
MHLLWLAWRIGLQEAMSKNWVRRRQLQGKSLVKTMIVILMRGVGEDDPDCDQCLCRRRPGWCQGLWLQTDRDQVGLQGERASGAGRDGGEDRDRDHHCGRVAGRKGAICRARWRRRSWPWSLSGRSGVDSSMVISSRAWFRRSAVSLGHDTFRWLWDFFVVL